VVPAAPSEVWREEVQNLGELLLERYRISDDNGSDDGKEIVLGKLRLIKDSFFEGPYRRRLCS
jgi:hypothetical protein